MIRGIHFHSLLMVFGLLSLLLSGCSPEPSNNSKAENTITKGDSPVKNNPTKRIVFFGNSLTAAFGLEPSQGFPAIIQEKIDSIDLPYKTVNAGLSGETTAGGKERISWVLKQPVDIFILELGGNDGLRGIAPPASAENLQAIIDSVRAVYPDAKLVIAGMEAPPNMGEAFTSSFRRIFRTLSEENEATLIPFLLEGVAGNPSLNLPDGIHPNVEGQQIVANTIWRYLFPLL